MLYQYLISPEQGICFWWLAQVLINQLLSNTCPCTLVLQCLLINLLPYQNVCLHSLSKNTLPGLEIWQV